MVINEKKDNPCFVLEIYNKLLRNYDETEFAEKEYYIERAVVGCFDIITTLAIGILKGIIIPEMKAKHVVLTDDMFDKYAERYYHTLAVFYAPIGIALECARFTNQIDDSKYSLDMILKDNTIIFCGLKDIALEKINMFRNNGIISAYLLCSSKMNDEEWISDTDKYEYGIHINYDGENILEMFDWYIKFLHKICLIYEMAFTSINVNQVHDHSIFGYSYKYDELYSRILEINDEIGECNDAYEYAHNHADDNTHASLSGMNIEFIAHNISIHTRAIRIFDNIVTLDLYKKIKEKEHNEYKKGLFDEFNITNSKKKKSPDINDVIERAKQLANNLSGEDAEIENFEIYDPDDDDDEESDDEDDMVQRPSVGIMPIMPGFMFGGFGYPKQMLNNSNQTVKRIGILGIKELSDASADEIYAKGNIGMMECISTVMKNIYSSKIIDELKWSRKYQRKFSSFIYDSVESITLLDSIDDFKLSEDNYFIAMCMISKYQIYGIVFKAIEISRAKGAEFQYKPYVYKVDINDSIDTNGATLASTLITFTKDATDNKKFFDEDSDNDDKIFVVFPSFSRYAQFYHFKWLYDRLSKDNSVAGRNYDTVRLCADIFAYLSGCFATSISSSNIDLVLEEKDKDKSISPNKIVSYNVSEISDAILIMLKEKSISTIEVDRIIYTCEKYLSNNLIDIKAVGGPLKNAFVGLPDQTVIMYGERKHQKWVAKWANGIKRLSSGGKGVSAVIGYNINTRLDISNCDTNVYEFVKRIISANKFALYQYDK